MCKELGLFKNLFLPIGEIIYPFTALEYALGMKVADLFFNTIYFNIYNFTKRFYKINSVDYMFSTEPFPTYDGNILKSQFQHIYQNRVQIKKSPNLINKNQTYFMYIHCHRRSAHIFNCT